ncbi:hypothetical protein BOX37_03945 [Nocardia mangyaensis]|uniref:Uncharacterized protein n=2 Tax=Nocardia mangyaensis TaxID=2213200 RepID=A0A1J0W171_9NOCA|nr:hypothetical protein BOX37_03945 [Nocardia mangyaensis]
MGLDDALAGRGLRSATGLDLMTSTALRAVTRAHPHATEDLIAAAEAAFAGQLDGSNAAAERAEQQRHIAEIKARQQAARRERP